jgi:hypothetical protein
MVRAVVAQGRGDEGERGERLLVIVSGLFLISHPSRYVAALCSHFQVPR